MQAAYSDSQLSPSSQQEVYSGSLPSNSNNKQEVYSGNNSSNQLEVFLDNLTSHNSPAEDSPDNLQGACLASPRKGSNNSREDCSANPLNNSRLRACSVNLHNSNRLEACLANLLNSNPLEAYSVNLLNSNRLEACSANPLNNNRLEACLVNPPSSNRLEASSVSQRDNSNNSQPQVYSVNRVNHNNQIPFWEDLSLEEHYNLNRALDCLEVRFNLKQVAWVGVRGGVLLYLVLSNSSSQGE